MIEILLIAVAVIAIIWLLYSMKESMSSSIFENNIAYKSPNNPEEPLQYGDWMLALELEAEKQIAGCNSPPNVMELLYG